MFFKGPKGTPVSPFHDIPLYANSEKTTFNMVVEVPRWSNAKMEITTSEKLNPIKQDIKKGKLRYVKNCFPHHGYIWNYGALPQTWEDPSHTDENTKCNGDNDPLDVCEIGHRVAKMGDVIEVKVLGTLALIDEGETDWKVMVIDVKDPLAEKLNDIADIEKEMPGFIENTFHWFRIYKVPDGKPENQFAFEDKPKDKAFALKVIEQTHEQWQKLMQGKADAGSIACENLSVAGSAHVIDAEAAQGVLDKAPACGGTPNEVASSVDLWHFVVSKS